jgi:hypothetical protein
MRPLQMWLPDLVSNPRLMPMRADRLRAYEEWDGQDVVWLMPGLPASRAWIDRDGTSCLAIPAEDFDRIAICHVDSNGCVAGPGARDRFRDGNVAGLLEAWLGFSQEQFGAESRVLIAEHVDLPMPQFGKDSITYVKRAIEISPRYAGPPPAEEETDEAVLTWPQHAISRKPVPRDAEQPIRNTLYPVPEPHRSLLLTTTQWPEPVGALMPVLTSQEEVRLRAQMVLVARRSQDDSGAALDHARTLAQDHVTEGITSAWLMECLPILTDEGERGLREFLRTKHDVGEPASDAKRREVEEELRSQKVPIRRTWGPIGLFWALLLDQLEQHRTFGVCERCSRVFQGSKNKQYCSELDDPQCFRARRTEDTRRYRNRQTRESHRR